MPITISQEFKINPDRLQKEGAFDSFLDIDTRLFINPNLLRITTTPELKKSYQKLLEHFSKIIKVLSVSQKEGDRFWRQADKLFTFHEFSGICTGYSQTTTAGSGMGRELRRKILESAKAIIDEGIVDPEIFLLVGLFEEGIGCDRIGDMVARIISEDLIKFTLRVVKNLGIEQKTKIKFRGYPDEVPSNHYNGQPLIFLPYDIIDALPEALDWRDIDTVCFRNEALRNEINELIGYQWSDDRKKLTKKELKHVLLRNPNLVRGLLDAQKERKVEPYDFDNDPAGEVIWYKYASIFAQKFPLKLSLQKKPRLDDVDDVVKEIINHFKELVENKGLWKSLFNTKLKKPYPESTAQRLFYVVADVYCKANNLDISPEANAGRGPVDFKISAGYNSRVVVEIKLSTNPFLVKGYQKQLPIYMKAESSIRGRYLVIDFGDSEKQIKKLFDERNSIIDKNPNAPIIELIDASSKLSASKSS